jgi:hypothetical protein
MKPKTGEEMPENTRRTGIHKRAHISWAEALLDVADYMGGKTFGNKSAYLAHLLLKDLERQGLTVPQIAQLAKEWREEQAAYKAAKKSKKAKP